MKRYTILSVCVVMWLASTAQVILKGSITNESGEAAQFVNVTLFTARDTITPVDGTLTDMEGNYEFPARKPGRYRAVVSGIGYETLTEDLRVRMPSTGNMMERNFVVKESGIGLDEVTVVAPGQRYYADKTVYTFNKEQVRNARHSADLISGMAQLTVDPIDNKITKFGGGSVKILINGVNATDNDLKAIPADKILRVEYYDIPPARYSTVGTLINVITKRLDTGLGGGVDVSSAFTTGFVNGNAYLKRVVGNHQFSLNYGISYRDYDERFSESQRSYCIDGDEIAYQSLQKDAFGYTTHNINLKYLYSNGAGDMFQATFSPNFETRFEHGNSDISKQIGDVAEDIAGKTSGDVKTFGPSVDLYYSKELPDNQELDLNIVGTYYNNSQSTFDEERNKATDAEELYDRMELENSKYSIIGEVAYKKTWGLNTFSAGYYGMWTTSDSKISNFLSGWETYKYKSGGNNHYLYAEYSGNSNRLMYRLGGGVTMINTDNDNARYTQWMFAPVLILSYRTTAKSKLMLSISSSPSTPSISQLSNNARLLASGLIHRGNPNLKSAFNYGTQLYYQWNNRIVDLSAMGIAIYTDKPISTYYGYDKIDGQTYVVSTYENADYMLQYGAGVMAAIKPFGSELLTMKVSTYALKQQLKSSMTGTYSHWYIPLDYSIDFRYNKWGASYSGKIVSKAISGPYLNKDENKSSLQAYYQTGGFRFSVGVHWFLTKSKYQTEMLPNDVIKYFSKTWIDDNKSMVTIGFSWNFNKGKSLDEHRELQNRDSDRGTF